MAMRHLAACLILIGCGDSVSAFDATPAPLTPAQPAPMGEAPATAVEPSFAPPSMGPPKPALDAGSQPPSEPSVEPMAQEPAPDAGAPLAPAQPEHAPDAGAPPQVEPEPEPVPVEPAPYIGAGPDVCGLSAFECPEDACGSWGSPECGLVTCETQLIEGQSSDNHKCMHNQRYNTSDSVAPFSFNWCGEPDYPDLDEWCGERTYPVVCGWLSTSFGTRHPWCEPRGEENITGRTGNSGQPLAWFCCEETYANDYSLP